MVGDSGYCYGYELMLRSHGYYQEDDDIWNQSCFGKEKYDWNHVYCKDDDNESCDYSKDGYGLMLKYHNYCKGGWWWLEIIITEGLMKDNAWNLNYQVASGK